MHIHCRKSLLFNSGMSLFWHQAITCTIIDEQTLMKFETIYNNLHSKNVFEYIVCKMLAIIFMPPCVSCFLQDTNFMTALELAVRFGKTLVIQEMDGVEPVLFPLLRGDLIAQGPRFVVQIGEKTIDYNEEFRLFLTTRNPAPEIPPDAASVVTEVNFTTTRAGLTGQVCVGYELLNNPARIGLLTHWG